MTEPVELPILPIERVEGTCQRIWWNGYSYLSCNLPPDHYGPLSDHGDFFVSWREEPES